MSVEIYTLPHKLSANNLLRPVSTHFINTLLAAVKKWSRWNQECLCSNSPWANLLPHRLEDRVVSTGQPEGRSWREIEAASRELPGHLKRRSNRKNRRCSSIRTNDLPNRVSTESTPSLFKQYKCVNVEVTWKTRPRIVEIPQVLVLFPHDRPARVPTELPWTVG